MIHRKRRTRRKDAFIACIIVGKTVDPHPRPDIRVNKFIYGTKGMIVIIINANILNGEVARIARISAAGKDIR